MKKFLEGEELSPVLFPWNVILLAPKQVKMGIEQGMVGNMPERVFIIGAVPEYLRAIRNGLFQHLQRADPRIRITDFILFVGKDISQCIADASFIIDDKNL